MFSPLTSRPVSSVRDQQASPRLPSITNTSLLKHSLATPSPRIRSTPSDHSAPITESDDRRSSPFASSASVSSFGHRSVSTVATSAVPHQVDHLPPIAPTTRSPRSAWSHPHLAQNMNSIDKADIGVRRPSPPQPLRRPTSPASSRSIPNHSSEWDRHSDRGSPRMAGRRPTLPPPAAPSASAASGPHSGYAREYASPRASYREPAYRGELQSALRERELSPGAPGLKRKLSIGSDLGARRAMPDRIDRNGNAWASADYPSRAAYPEPGYYRGRERADSPERAYASSYGRNAAYSSRYPEDRLPDPRHAHPASPSSSRTAYHRGYDSATPSGRAYHPSRRDRYSPGPMPGSPSYAPRQVLPPPQAPPADGPYSRSTPHSSYATRRQSPPPFAADVRPQLPPLSSRNTPASRYPAPPPPAPAGAAPRGRGYTPPLESSRAERMSPTPEPHAYSEPFYPDRRLYFARERIQDPEMDDFYHGPLGAGAGKGGRYADYAYDPYGSPHAGHYAPPGSMMGKAPNGAGPMSLPPPGMGGMRQHDRMACPGGYSPGDYMPDPRDMRAHQGMGRPMPMPATHVPPGPSAGIAPPPRRRGKLPKPVTDLLKGWLLEHASHPYPTEDEKRSLCSMTGLTLSQVSNWFINARRRILLPSGANGSPNGGSTAAQVKAAFSGDSPSPEP